MRIPPDAIIADDKLTKYLLLHRQWDDKSGFLGRGGFTLANWELLRDAIRELAGSSDAVEDGRNEYGVFYRVEGLLVGPADALSVTLIWMQRAVDQRFYFVTLKGAQGEPIMKLYDRVVLKIAVREHALRPGDVATLVEFVDHPSGGERGCVLEIFNAVGESIAVVTVPQSAIEPLRPDEILTARPLAAAG